MNATRERIAELAAELSKAFEPAPRTCECGCGAGCRSLADNLRDRWQDLCHEAHGDMAPDDWKYHYIEDAADYLADAANDPDEYNPEPDIYNADLIRWFGSNAGRWGGYVEDAVEEAGGLGDGGIMGALQYAQAAERREVFDLVRAALERMAEEKD